MNTKNKGFTLIELLVVIAIISLLSSVVLASLNSARRKARDIRRLSDFHQISLALELYYNANGNYPNTGGSERSQCSAWGGFASSDVIPGLVPVYMSSFPSDPSMNTAGNLYCYFYKSNGVDYMFMDHNGPEINYNSQPSLIDPARDGGTDNCTVDGNAPWAWKIYSVYPGAFKCL